MARSTPDRPTGIRPAPPPAPPARATTYQQPPTGPARVKCRRCGRWGDEKTQCEGCGAPLDPATTPKDTGQLRPSFPPNRTVK